MSGVFVTRGWPPPYPPIHPRQRRTPCSWSLSAWRRHGRWYYDEYCNTPCHLAQDPGYGARSCTSHRGLPSGNRWIVPRPALPLSRRLPEPRRYSEVSLPYMGAAFLYIWPQRRILRSPRWHLRENWAFPVTTGDLPCSPPPLISGLPPPVAVYSPAEGRTE